MDVFKSHLAGRRDAVGIVHVRRGSAPEEEEEEVQRRRSSSSEAAAPPRTGAAQSIRKVYVARRERGAYLPTDLTSRSILTAFEEEEKEKKKMFLCAGLGGWRGGGGSCATRSRCRS